MKQQYHIELFYKRDLLALKRQVIGLGIDAVIKGKRVIARPEYLNHVSMLEVLGFTRLEVMAGKPAKYTEADREDLKLTLLANGVDRSEYNKGEML